MNYVTVNMASKQSQLSCYLIMKLVGLGEIRHRALPGRAIEVCLEDAYRCGEERKRQRGL